MKTKEMIEVMQAFIDGAGIQERPDWDQEEEAWKDVMFPKWNWEKSVYRICPEKPAKTAEDVLAMMKAIEAKYQKMIAPIKEFEQTLELELELQDNRSARGSIFIQATSTANQREKQFIQEEMTNEIHYLIKRYPKLALEAGLLYVKEL